MAHVFSAVRCTVCCALLLIIIAVTTPATAQNTSDNQADGASVDADSQAEAAPSPVEFVKKTDLALQEGRYEDYARDIHPEELEQFRQLMLEVYKIAEDQGQAPEILRLFQGVDSGEQLRELDDHAFFAAFLEGMMSSMPGVKDAVSGSTSEILGQVKEGEDTVHVVYRAKLPLGETGVMVTDVVTLKAHQSGWAMVIDDDIQIMAQGMHFHINQQQQ